MRKLTTVFFVVISAVCAVGWLSSWVGNAAIGKWIIDKGYMPPTDEELSECVAYVWRNLFRVK